jgi:hypothetical protein
MLPVLHLDPVLLPACVAKHRAAVSLPNLRRSFLDRADGRDGDIGNGRYGELPMSGNQFDG